MYQNVAIPLVSSYQESHELISLFICIKVAVSGVKKVGGRTYYFGTDPVEAEKEWDRVKDDLRAGRTPEAQSSSEDTLTVE